VTTLVVSIENCDTKVSSTACSQFAVLSIQYLILPSRQVMLLANFEISERFETLVVNSHLNNVHQQNENANTILGLENTKIAESDF
jgi:hypothetical protein